jgi:hypothetical protein
MTNATSPTKNKDDARSTFGGASLSDLTNKVENAGAAGLDKAKEMASSVAHTIGEAGATVEKKANEATSAVGGSMKSLAGTIREKAPHEGKLGTASEAVADTLDKGGRFLQQEGLAGVGGEITECIRRNPIAAVLVGIGFGFLLAKITTRS